MGCRRGRESGRLRHQKPRPLLPLDRPDAGGLKGVNVAAKWQDTQNSQHRTRALREFVLGFSDYRHRLVDSRGSYLLSLDLAVARDTVNQPEL